MSKKLPTTSQKLNVLNMYNKALVSVPMNKRNHVIETKLPDGKHWFYGIGEMAPGVFANKWSPYLEDAIRFDYVTALEVKRIMLPDVEGVTIPKFTDATDFYLKNPYDPNKNASVPVSSLPAKTYDEPDNEILD